MKPPNKEVSYKLKLLEYASGEPKAKLKHELMETISNYYSFYFNFKNKNCKFAAKLYDKSEHSEHILLMAKKSGQFPGPVVSFWLLEDKAYKYVLRISDYNKRMLNPDTKRAQAYYDVSLFDKIAQGLKKQLEDYQHMDFLNLAEKRKNAALIGISDLVPDVKASSIGPSPFPNMRKA